MSNGFYALTLALLFTFSANALGYGTNYDTIYQAP